MRTRYYWDKDLEAWVSGDNYRATGPTLHVIRDDLPGGLDGMVSHADGQRYTSKAAYTRGVRRAGCEVVGNERTDHIKRPPLHAPREVGLAIKQAFEQHMSRSR